MAGFTDKFSVRVKKERKKIKDLPGFKSKISYIWDYYKIPILSVIIGAIAVISVVRSIRSNNYETALYVSYVNCISMDLRDNTMILNRTLTQWLGIDGKDTRVSVDGYYQIDPDTFSEDTYSSTQKLNVLIVARNSDCYLSDDLFAKTWASYGNLADLETFLTPELLNKLEGRLLYYENGDTGETHAFGVDLTGLPFITDVLVFGNEHPVFSVVANAPHPKACITFLENMLDYK